MKKVFYTAIATVMLATACNTSTDKGAIADAAKGLEKGQAGTFTFSAKDGVTITADYYPNEKSNKIIILLHQADFSRGEYNNIAPRLVDSGFACIAVDLRSGKMVNEIYNETAKSAASKGLSTSYTDAKQDVQAAITYAAENTDKEIILWGSSYSASLALMVASEEPKVSKVVTFSPGEYLTTQNTVKNAVSNLNKPVFVTGASAEYDLVVKPIVNALTNAQVTEYKPSGMSDHGSKTLWINSSETNTVYTQIVDFLNR